MRYIAFNTAGFDTEIVVKFDDKILYSRGEGKYRTSEILLPMLDEMLEELNLSIKDFDCFGCVVGPGSFTGIRIGVNTVKAFAYSFNKPCVSLDHLKVLAYGLDCDSDVIVSALDGSNGTMYTAVFDQDREYLLQPKCMLAEDFNKFAELIDEPFSLVADSNLVKVLSAQSPQEYALQKAMDKEVLKCNFTDYNKIEPHYIRVSQAERKEGEL